VVIPVQTALVTFGNLTANNTSAGAVSPETQSSVAAGSAGTVRVIFHKAGEWVRAGEPVIQLDDAQLKLSLQLAQTAYQNAVVNAGFDESGKPSPNSTIALKIQYAQSDVAAKQKTYEADQGLFKIGGVTQTTLDTDLSNIQNSQATLESLKASVQQSAMAIQTASLQVQQAQLNLANAAVKAPFDGQISAVNVHPGEYVTTSTAAFVLVSRQKIITFSVPPSDAPGLAIGTKVKYSYSGVDYAAGITQIPAAPVGGLIPLTASLPLNLSPPLGTVGTITYALVLAQGNLVPLQAIQSAENSTFVFTVDKANKVGKSIVGVLAETGAFAAVSGVTAGQTVIINPPPGILVGATVQPQAAANVQAAPGTGAAPGDKAAGQAPGSGQGTGQRGQRQGGTPAADAAPGPGAPQAAGDATAGAPGAGGRGNFDPSKLTPEQRAAFQARRKAAAEAAGGTGASPSPAPTGGQ
jgi:multidrug efflux pump subunit AcrA (membrane-fusion protein)